MSTSSSPSLSSTMTTDEVCYNWLYFFTNIINVTIFWMTKLQSDSNKLTMLLCVLVVVYSSLCTRCRVLVVVYSSLCTRGCVLVVVYCRRVLLCGNMDDIWVLCWWQSDKWNMNEWMSRECYPNVTRMLPNCHCHWHIATINEIMS